MGENMARQSSLRRPPNVSLLDAILIAAEQVGEDGKGAGGLVGYVRGAARKHPGVFLSALAKLPPDTALENKEPLKRYTPEEFIAELRKRGIPEFFVAQFVGRTGQGPQPKRPRPKTGTS